MVQADRDCVLVVAAHPDDELLGCGGTIAWHADNGDSVHILIVAEGATSRDRDRAVDVRSEELNELQRSALEAAEILGSSPPDFLGFPDNRLDAEHLLDVVKAIEAKVSEIRPKVVYTHHGGDLNVDHRVVHQAVVTACRPLPDSEIKAVLCFETLSSTEWASRSLDQGFRPTHFVDISRHMDRKQAALSCYVSEMRAFPHPRSHEAVDALARLRGSAVGVAAAEAFEPVFTLRT